MFSLSANFLTCFVETFVVIAPDHSLMKRLVEHVANKEEVLDFCEKVLKEKSASANKRINLAPEGIFTGTYAVDPITKKNLPIWVANFVIADYATGIVRCSAHDERDFEFAKKYKIDLKIGLVPEDEELKRRVENFECCYSDMQNGILIFPENFSLTLEGSVMLPPTPGGDRVSEASA